jgi:hypothetical protein
VALGDAEDVYFTDTDENEIKKWTPTTDLVAFVSTTGISPVGVKLDVAGNVYMADFVGNPILKWTEASQKLTTLVPAGSGQPGGLAVDGAGNIYFADVSKNAIDKLMAADGSLSTLVPKSAGLFGLGGVAVDGTGNVYIANGDTNAILELPYAFVDPTPKLEGVAAGSDSLPPVLPTTQNLLAPFAPTSDQSWLTITGITNGVVSFSFAANNGSARTANIALLGQTIPITQGVIGTPPKLEAAQLLTNGVLQFSFINNPQGAFTVVSSTDLSLPISKWTPVGTATNSGFGVFEFTMQPNVGEVQRYYGVRSP